MQAQVLYWEQATEAVWLQICPALRVPVPRSFLHEFFSCFWSSTTSRRQTFGLQLPHASCVSIQRTECADTTKQDAVRRRFKDLDRKSDGRSIIYIYIYISWQRRRWPPNWGLAEARPKYRSIVRLPVYIFVPTPRGVLLRRVRAFRLVGLIQMMHAGAESFPFFFLKSFVNWRVVEIQMPKKSMQETSAAGLRQGRSEVKQLPWLVLNIKPSLHVRAIVDLTHSVRNLRVRSPKICWELPRKVRLVNQQMTGEWMAMVQRQRGIFKKQSLGMTRKVDGKRFRKERNSNKNVSQVRSGKRNADVKDKLWRPHACMFQTGLRKLLDFSCKTLLLYRTP